MGAGVGLVLGLVVGHNEFGWAGAIIGAVVGIVGGYLLGATPCAVAGFWLRYDLRRSDTADLKARLGRQYAPLYQLGESLLAGGVARLGIAGQHKSDEDRLAAQRLRRLANHQ